MSAALIAKLAAWSLDAGDYHGDRQLSDEVLIACGWQVLPDAAFEGGARWFIGRNPQYSCAETQRPHPLLRVDDALALLPPDCFWLLGAGRVRPAEPLYGAQIRHGVIGHDDVIAEGEHEAGAAVAMCLAAVRARIS